MTRKPPIRHIEKLEEWLETYPDFDFDGFFRVYEYMPFPSQGSGALVPTETMSAISQDIVGETSVTRNHYVTLYARKSGIDDVTNKANPEFLTDFHHWVVEEQIFGTIPKFGNVDTDRELLEIAGAVRWQNPEGGPGTEDYMWQLRLQYKLLYY